jgi:hypothetical protein
MSTSDYLGTYAEGWTTGDAETILKAVSNDYILDDPNAGQITKENFKEYLETLKETVESLRGGASEPQFMALSEVVTLEDPGGLTAWCWWSVPGTSIQGGGLIKVNADGVSSERLTYYTKLPG